MVASSEDKKRGISDISRLDRPMFPEPGGDFYSASFKKYQFRDNSLCLQRLCNQAIFLRPSQLGKSSLLYLAYLIYDKKKRCPNFIKFQPEDKNTRYVLRVNFLRTTGKNPREIDEAVLKKMKKAVRTFLKSHEELKPFYEEPERGADAGDYLKAVAEAVSDYGVEKNIEQALLVLVDEYDVPVRDHLINMIGTNGTNGWENYRVDMVNYRNFFTACKEIVESVVIYPKLENIMVWTTGILPVALNILSGYNPKSYTFDQNFADAIGVLGEDVESHLDVIHEYLPFADGEREKIRDAVRNLGNRLYFANPDVSLYHTRVVNGMMAALTDENTKRTWLDNLSRYPPGIAFQRGVPGSVFDIIKAQDHKEIGEVARKLSLNEEIYVEANPDLKLDDLVTSKMRVQDYLTFLAHLGIVSYRQLPDETEGKRNIFQATSVCFRIEFFERLLENSMQPLFDARDLDDLYSNGVNYVKDFMYTLPKSGISSLIHWANSRGSQSRMELQFHFLVETLSASLWNENVVTSQEDIITTSKQRTDVRITGEKTIILLELKQTHATTPPDRYNMDVYHKQLSGYMSQLVAEEKTKPNPRQVAGFLVVMYNNGMSFAVEKTTYTWGNEVTLFF